MVNNDEYMNIVNQYKKPLFKYCFYRLMNNTTLAQETLDDVFYILYKKWDNLDLNGNIRAYLYRVADNCIKHNLTRFNRYYKNNESLEEAVENRKSDIAYYIDDYFNDSAFDETIYIEKIKQLLPEEYQKIFVYRYIEKKNSNRNSQSYWHILFIITIKNNKNRCHDKGFNKKYFQLIFVISANIKKT